MITKYAWVQAVEVVLSSTLCAEYIIDSVCTHCLCFHAGPPPVIAGLVKAPKIAPQQGYTRDAHTAPKAYYLTWGGRINPWGISIKR